MKQSYSEQIKSPKWQKKRLEILQLHNFKCEECNSTERQLHVHHSRYIKNRKAWEYDNDIFQVLCSICHNKKHTVKCEIPEFLITTIELLNEIDKFHIESLNFILKELQTCDYPEFLVELASVFNGCGYSEVMDKIKEVNERELLSIEISIIKTIISNSEILQKEIKLRKKEINDSYNTLSAKHDFLNNERQMPSNLSIKDEM